MWSKYPELSNELQIVESFIKKNIRSRNKLLTKITRELIEAGGKRLRPALAIISSKFGDYDREKAVAVAGAIEILHTATLVHDDIIDRSKLRRGKVTVSEKYGSDMAVYTGDFLFTKAVLMFSKNITVNKLDRVAGAIKTICEGEVDQFQDRFNINTSVFSYLKRIKRKTAILFAAACAMGASIAECPDNIVRDLTRFGLFYGMAFQIRDDLNDFLSTPSVSGKPIGNDIMKGVITLPIIYSLKKSKALKGTISEFISKKDDKKSAEEVSKIMDMVKKAGGIEESKRLLEKYILKASSSLNNLPESHYKNILSDLANMLKLD